MPTLPKARKRPWKPAPTPYKPQEGRKVTNPFYHTKAWRNFRTQQKAEAIEKTKRIMLSLIAENKTVPLVFAKLQPLCVECLKETTFRERSYSVARILDHIKPINPRDAYTTMRGRYGEPLSKQNVQWLCEKHHAAKSGREHVFHKNVK